MVVYFNPKVKFSQLVFRREKAEGRYISEAEPFHINYDKVDCFGDGVIKLDNGETIYVEQDSEQIQKILDAKLIEAEKYNEHMRVVGLTGVNPDAGPEEEV